MADSPINPLASLSEIAASLPRQPISSTSPNLAPASLKSAPIGIKQRRLSNASQSRRRHSDATAATLTNKVVSRICAPGTTALSASVGIAPTHSRSRSGVPANDEILPSSLPPSTVIEHLKEPPLSIHALKKKGQVFKCESCAKVYRHPSCLVKHRWEHSPHWHETSKFLLSKHQQVQLLEAAAILSHVAPPNPNAKPAPMSPEPSAPAATMPPSGITTRTSAKLAAATTVTSPSPLFAAACDGDVPPNFEEAASLSLGTSLPEDRSLWPFFVSGGAVVTSLSFANGPTQRNARAGDSDDEVFEEDDEDEDVEVEVVSSISGSHDHDVERADDKDDENGEEREDSGYASSGGGGAPASESANQRAGPPSQNANTRSTRARSHSASTSASLSVTRGGGTLLSVPEMNDPDEGKMLTRSRSRSNASATAHPLTTMAASSGLGATRPARLSSQVTSAPSHGGHHRRSSSTGYHPYGSYRSSTTAPLSSSTGTSLGSTGVNTSSRARSHSHSRGVSCDHATTSSSITSSMSIPPPPPVPMLFGAGQRGVAIIDGSGSHHPYAFGTLPSHSSYGCPRAGGGSFAGNGSGIANSSIPMPRSSIISNIRSLDEEDESLVDAEEIVDDGSLARGASRALDLRSVGTSAISELEEGPPGDCTRERDDDQETVDGSWDDEDEQAGGMAMDMDL